MKTAGSVLGFTLIVFSMFTLLSASVLVGKPAAPVELVVIMGVVMLIAGMAFARMSSGKSCPSCNEKVKSKANVCRHCGHSFI
jgi:amino acid transporter